MEAASSSKLSILEGHAIGEGLAEQAAHLDAATHRFLTDLRAFEASGEWPLIDDALRLGKLSYCKVRALTRVATSENEALLLHDATYTTTPQLESICRKYASVYRRARRHPAEDAAVRTVSARPREDGMVALHAVLHPDEAALVMEALTKVAREREGRFCRADALVDLAQQVMRGTSPERSPTELVVTVAVEVLADGDGVAVCGDGTVVSTETAERLACDCGIVEVREDAEGAPLTVGRKTRSIPASLKRALLRRDEHCRFPGCDNRVFLEGHHIQHWAKGGETELANLLCLCSHHHHFVHEYGFRVELVDGEPQFRNQLGWRVPAVPAPLSPPQLGWETIERLNAPLSITPSTNAPRWDGDAPNYDWIIQDLCRLGPPEAERRG